jgi:hypothetical protein
MSGGRTKTCAINQNKSSDRPGIIVIMCSIFLAKEHNNNYRGVAIEYYISTIYKCRAGDPSHTSVSRGEFIPDPPLSCWRAGDQLQPYPRVDEYDSRK